MGRIACTITHAFGRPSHEQGLGHGTSKCHEMRPMATKCLADVTGDGPCLTDTIKQGLQALSAIPQILYTDLACTVCSISSSREV